MPFNLVQEEHCAGSTRTVLAAWEKETPDFGETPCLYLYYLQTSAIDSFCKVVVLSISLQLGLAALRIYGVLTFAVCTMLFFRSVFDLFGHIGNTFQCLCTFDWSAHISGIKSISADLKNMAWLIDILTTFSLATDPLQSLKLDKETQISLY